MYSYVSLEDRVRDGKGVEIRRIPMSTKKGAPDLTCVVVHGTTRKTL